MSVGFLLTSFVGFYQGASAVLIYGASEVPPAQPLTGIIITKLFQLLPNEERFDELAWLAASLACATSIVVIQVTQSMHPSAGATALLPATNKEIRDIERYCLPVMLLTSVLACAVALITNNVQRRYPVFWLTPIPPKPPTSSPPKSIADTSESNGTTTPSAVARYFNPVV
ncbi:hypothetical protein AN958_01341 [Leucoagaricus sp. SymC.cos]|nr:hypothetical protein AN958_01341 [Leucoagaricus sp. SymC.cos]